YIRRGGRRMDLVGGNEHCCTAEHMDERFHGRRFCPTLGSIIDYICVNGTRGGQSASGETDRSNGRPRRIGHGRGAGGGGGRGERGRNRAHLSRQGAGATPRRSSVWRH